MLLLNQRLLITICDILNLIMLLLLPLLLPLLLIN
jgi:hypothetical protein